MAHQGFLVALGMAAAALPMVHNGATPSAAPSGTPNTRYCLRVEPITGSRIETIQCRTREDWAELGLDVDQEWAENGVRVLG